MLGTLSSKVRFLCSHPWNTRSPSCLLAEWYIVCGKLKYHQGDSLWALRHMKYRIECVTLIPALAERVQNLTAALVNPPPPVQRTHDQSCAPRGRQDCAREPRECDRIRCQEQPPLQRGRCGRDSGVAQGRRRARRRRRPGGRLRGPPQGPARRPRWEGDHEPRTCPAPAEGATAGAGPRKHPAVARPGHLPGKREEITHVQGYSPRPLRGPTTPHEKSGAPLPHTTETNDQKAGDRPTHLRFVSLKTPISHADLSLIFPHPRKNKQTRK